MPRRTPPPLLVENSGDMFADLATAQNAARSATAHDLARTLRGLLAAGRLVNHNGKIIPSPEDV
jgi:hypothetical protein